MTDIIQNRTVPEKQTALLTLASLEGSKDLPVWKQILADFDDGKLPEGTWIELEEAITQTESSELKAEFTSLLDKRAGDEPWKKNMQGHWQRATVEEGEIYFSKIKPHSVFAAMLTMIWEGMQGLP